MQEDEGTVIKQENIVNTISTLLEVGTNELKDSLTGRVIAASGEVVRKIHNEKDAGVGRDALAKVFSHINYDFSLEGCIETLLSPGTDPICACFTFRSQSSVIL